MCVACCSWCSTLHSEAWSSCTLKSPTQKHMKRLDLDDKLRCVEKAILSHHHHHRSTITNNNHRRLHNNHRAAASAATQRDQYFSTVATALAANRSEEEEHILEQYADMARRIAEQCVLEQKYDERMEWNLKNAGLFGFGILTTLGYGKIEPQTTNGRLFTVIYGFVGVPFTVIIFTNFGRYIQNLERYIRRKYCSGGLAASLGRRRRRSSAMSSGNTSHLEEGSFATFRPNAPHGVILSSEPEPSMQSLDEEEEGQIFGAALMSHLNDQVDFFNGIYYAFLCLSAIEFGSLTPNDSWYLPLVISYICFGLAISTIALDIGSTYVKRLYFVGRKIRHIAGVKIWFGSKNLRVRELLAALGHNIGLEPSVLCDLDLEQLVSNAIQVKEGRLNRVPQTHMIMDGIWPPELVPLFLKDGHFPDFVDAEDKRGSVISASAGKKNSILPLDMLPDSLPPDAAPPALPHSHKFSVRFEDVVDAWRRRDEALDSTSSMHPFSRDTTLQSVLMAADCRGGDTTSGISDPDSYSISSSLVALPPGFGGSRRSTLDRPSCFVAEEEVVQLVTEPDISASEALMNAGGALQAVDEQEEEENN
uniref:Potassium channel domain-containing protein n=1 Tax=Ditylenchus dipsaci TaxID=166011 RepID=A0A915DHX4_9BILA